MKGKLHPGLALALAILAGAAILVFVMKGPAVEAPARVPAAAALPEVTSSKPAPPPVAPASRNSGNTSAAEVEAFRAHLRRTLLRGFDWLTSPPARELYLAGHPREAVDRNLADLGAQSANGDREASATLYRLVAECRNTEVRAAMEANLLAQPHWVDEIKRHASDLGDADRAKAAAYIEASNDDRAAMDQKCRNLDRVDFAALEASVRQSASDGHVPSLASLGRISLHDPSSPAAERFLLSASLLGDPDSQWLLAQLYSSRRQPDDAQKSRFWLEQAADKVPEAAFTLGLCLQNQCADQPANPERATRLIENAAGQGSVLALNYFTDEKYGADIDPATRYAWSSFRSRLADEGCNAGYGVLLVSDDTAERAKLRDDLRPGERTSADSEAQALYDRYGAAARKASGCD